MHQCSVDSFPSIYIKYYKEQRKNASFKNAPLNIHVIVVRGVVIYSNQILRHSSPCIIYKTVYYVHNMQGRRAPRKTGNDSGPGPLTFIQILIRGSNSPRKKYQVFNWN